jgi:hypothetical protein
MDIAVAIAPRLSKRMVICYVINAIRTFGLLESLVPTPSRTYNLQLSTSAFVTIQLGSSDMLHYLRGINYQLDYQDSFLPVVNILGLPPCCIGCLSWLSNYSHEIILTTYNLQLIDDPTVYNLQLTTYR